MDTLFGGKVDQFDRVFKLHRLLAGRRVPVAFEDLQLELECSRSTLRRTIDFLRDRLQAPLQYDRELDGYRYEPGRGYEIPGLWFSAEELSALLVLDELIRQQPVGLLADALSPVRNRIEKLLEQSGIGLPQWRSRLRLLRIGARKPGSQFGIAATAIASRKRLRIDYHARSSDRMQPRSVSPQRLTLYRDNWYLDAWCHQREALRTFALDRIIAAEPLDTAAIDVPDATLDRALATSYGIFAGEPTATAELRFSPQATRWVAMETWHPDQSDTIDEHGHLSRRLPYHRDDELIMDLLRHGPDVEVLAPKKLREAVAEKLRKALNRYE